MITHNNNERQDIMSLAKIQKKFCIAGPVVPSKNYYISHRLDWDQLKMLIDDWQYFVLHAPRQSGKTTAIEEFIAGCNDTGSYVVLYINIEPAQAARDNIEKALVAVVNQLANAIDSQLPKDEKHEEIVKTLRCQTAISLTFLLDALRYISRSLEKPVILFIDEIDSAIGDSLLSILRQIRAGYAERPDNFPQSICLIGLRDVRDYRIWSRQDEKYIAASSPFNIKAVSLKLANFSIEDVKNLYGQHTQATGQEFTDEAIEHAHYLTQGQPWLVNALAYEACFVLDRSKAITKEIIERAKDTIILRRDTHIDSLLDKLNEPRVAAVIDSIISGSVTTQQFSKDDELYCIDLGILSSTADTLEIANPIYKQIIPAVLASKFQHRITTETRTYLNQDGSLNIIELLKGFTQFYRENSEPWLAGYNYKEAGPHILMLAYMQKLINGGGTIKREYALGHKRVDLFIEWKHQRFVLELKIKRAEKALNAGLEQIADYMDKAGAKGHLILFDRSEDKSWDQKISNEELSFDEKKIHVWTM